MTKDEMKVFKRAEELLAKIQHHKLLPMQDVREALRREIRDYFSSYERGQVIALDALDRFEEFAEPADQ